MNEIELTEAEMREMINIEITKAYPKMQKDFLRISSYNHQQFEELLPFCLEQFLTKKSIHYQFKVCVTDKAILNYMGRSMSLNLRSSSSPYWNKIRKQPYNFRGIYLAENQDAYIRKEYDIITEPDEQDNFDCMLIQLDKLSFYHKPLVIDYFLNGMTYTKMFEKYKISIQHLKQAIDEGLETIRQECKKQQEL